MGKRFGRRAGDSMLEHHDSNFDPRLARLAEPPNGCPVPTYPLRPSILASIADAQAFGNREVNLK